MRNSNIRTVASLIALALTSCGVCLAQSTQLAQSDAADVLRASSSPFEIASVVNKSSRTWKKSFIQVDVDLSRVWERLAVDRGDFAGCAGDCEAEVFRHELDGKPGKETVLKLTKSFNSCRYLIFKRIHSGVPRRHRWILLGHIDHEFNRYQMARHRVVRAFGRNWFVLRGQEGSGSGYSLYGETWFGVTNRMMRPVLHYSVEGQTDPGVGGLRWQFKNRAVPLRTRLNNHLAIRLTFETLYTTNDFSNPDFGKHFRIIRHAFFVWNKHSREFTFDHRHSTISESEMNAVANTGDERSDEEELVKIGGTTFFSGLKDFVGSGFEMFVRLNFSRLKQIARGSDNRMKEWLRQFLEQCDEISEKTALEELLNNKLPPTSKQR